MDADIYSTWIQRDGLSKSFEESCTYLESHNALQDRLKTLCYLVPGTLFDSSPSDFDSLSKIGYEPFSEAQTDFRLAVAFMLQGAYKTAYHHLRSLFELYIVGVYCLLPTTSKETARAWLLGNGDTPFLKKMIKALFREPNFQFAEHRFQFKAGVLDTYRLLCNYVHSGGPKYRHRHLTGANCPRFNPQSLEQGIADIHQVLGDVCTVFVLHTPVLLKPLPVEQKFGINGPISGYLEEGQVEQIRFAIGASRIKDLDELVAADPGVKAIEEWFHSRPDISEEELKRQFVEFDLQMAGMTISAEQA